MTVLTNTELKIDSKIYLSHVNCGVFRLLLWLDLTCLRFARYILRGVSSSYCAAIIIKIRPLHEGCIGQYSVLKRLKMFIYVQQTPPYVFLPRLARLRCLCKGIKM